ncbi:hypothetical protein C1X25_38330, partial [Pseudomonas sp. GW247-3R2A]
FLQVLLILISGFVQQLDNDRHGGSFSGTRTDDLHKGDITLVFLSRTDGNLCRFVRPSAT